MTRRRGTPVEAGRFYRQTPRGLVPTDDAPPDVWVCRRLEDYPDGQAPPGAAVSPCTRCGAAIAYNPARVPTVPASTPRVCMQCFDIEPDPLLLTDDTRTDEDFAVAKAIMAAMDDHDQMVSLIVAYYQDTGRAARTPRAILYLHLGLLTGAYMHAMKGRP